jgi:hypothetical protein
MFGSSRIALQFPLLWRGSLEVRQYFWKLPRWSSFVFSLFVLIGIYLASDVLTFISGYLWDSDGYVKWWFDFRFFGRFDSYEPFGTLGTLLRGVLTKICLATMLVFALIPRRSQSFSSSPNLTPLSTQSFTPESPTTRSTGKFCTACGATVALGTAFCGKCGAALS